MGLLGAAKVHPRPIAIGESDGHRHRAIAARVWSTTLRPISCNAYTALYKLTRRRCTKLQTSKLPEPLTLQYVCCEFSAVLDLERSVSLIIIAAVAAPVASTSR